MTRLAYLLVSATSGFTILALEFAAVRQMAPSFGQSHYVWANVIGLILLALTVGYALGGRLAERSASGKPLFVAYGIVAAWSALAAFQGPALGAALIPEGLPTEGGLPLGFMGCLIATLVLYVPPAILLAMTSAAIAGLYPAIRIGRIAPARHLKTQ